MNIKEIAKKADVSVATVSRVLNHPENVAPKTREKILEIIKESGYKPNWFARGLNFNKTNTIGLLVSSFLNPGFMEIAKGVEDVALQKEYTTLLCSTEDNVARERKYVRTLIDRKVDGLVLVSSLLDREDLEMITEEGVPFVLIGENRVNFEGVPMVRVDCYAASVKATNHLIEVGHKKIGIILGKTPEHENLLKLNGYKDALKEAHLNLKEEYIAEGEDSIEGGYVAARRLIALENRPEAIMTSSDLIAIGAIDAIKDSGLTVPDDMAVMGFGNIRISNQLEPKLSTIAKPMHRMGLSGARLLFDAIESRDGGAEAPIREILLQSKLKIRKSCGHKERISEMF